tara:strand:- start:473 stop:583 length:111 start_codon:yes stop_codon:yes gene_type:complete
MQMVDGGGKEIQVILAATIPNIRFFRNSVTFRIDSE